MTAREMRIAGWICISPVAALLLVAIIAIFIALPWLFPTVLVCGLFVRGLKLLVQAEDVEMAERREMERANDPR
jgi:hypothetical protein